MIRILIWLVLSVASLPSAAAPAVALHYGKAPPLEALSVYDIIVVDPDHVPDPGVLQRQRSTLFAYVSLGEVHPGRAYAKIIPAAWQRGENPAWKSTLIDVSQPGYAAFFADRVIAPLWRKGYRGFFLDTLDSYQLIPGGDAKAMQRGLIDAIRTLHRQFPGIRLIANRGFELLPEIADHFEMVAAESLFRGYRPGTGDYVEVGAADRTWLLTQLLRARDEFKRPVLVIDYAPPADRALARETARRIAELGFTPWVSDGGLETIGIGAWEILPRRVAVFYDPGESPVPDRSSPGRYLAMPLEYLGFVPEFHSLAEPLPELSAATHAGAVIWPIRTLADDGALVAWLVQLADRGVPVALFSQFGFSFDADRLARFGLTATPPATRTSPIGALRIAERDPMLGFESQPRPVRASLQPVRLTAGDAARPLLTLHDDRQQRYTAAALTPWGGYVLDPFVVTELPGGEQARLIVDPFEFLRAALRLPELPVPDLTTENGRRLAFIHIDGDGFPSRGEFSGNVAPPFAGAVLRDEVLKRYRLPTTVSVIEGEIAPHGLYPQLAPELEAIAREIFALPYVDIASHTYSHPFRWYRAAGGDKRGDEDEAYHLALPDYQFNLQREIDGSVDYIEKRLAPPGKAARVFLWSGDAEPTAQALALADRRGLFNMNGGNTVISRQYPSLGAVSPSGVMRDGHFQTFAPMMNENVYTNLWTGPFYGYQRVIETFELTDRPRRLKPINVYYHAYSASKKASLSALHTVYDWLLKAEPHFIQAADYIAKARDFQSLSLARSTTDARRWRVSGGSALRTLRVAERLGHVEPGRSPQVAGERPGSDGYYLHLAAGEAEFRLGAPAGQTSPGLHDANARLAAWQRTADGLRFELRGHQPLRFGLGGLRDCRVRANGRPLLATANPAAPGPRAAAIHHFRLDDAAATVEVHCRPA